ncbi:MAG: hypothetical protein A2474_00550 [Elusimicrobia bacterium RIFOXYC2_FULL_34_12]|nr:MAG: hypothetical protein A2474_00550 [Elusimicrobia bacterium RIFOXYC2_FULL_34_12]OGS38416.1 MAG: hypothetical protein A2551_04495 [Elusimicrobia bacterium RIFOXYD2_FULL_34_30]HAM39605.1 hypothetical protein [Elusimicrobiota bacterium]
MFTHLHTHFIGSFSDSTLRIEDGIKKVKKIGQKAIAMTEHGEMPYFYEFLDKCEKYEIKPVFGLEIYFVDDAKKTIEKKDNNRFHLLLFAKNDIGYKNLISLVSDSWIKNNYNEKRGLVDWELLEKYSKGLIASTACFFNQVSQFYIKNNLQEAEKTLLRYKNIFGNDFYVELANHEIEDEKISNKGLLELAKKNDIKAIATNDVHYLEIEDWLAHDVVMKTRFDNISGFKAASQQYWLKSEKEMLNAGIPQEFLNNTQEIVEKCEFKLKDKKPTEMPDIESIETEITIGNAAYIPETEYIEKDKADFFIKRIIGENHPDKDYYAEKIIGIPRKQIPNTNKIAYFPNIKENIPLKVVLGKVITQFNEKSCQRAGAIILPTIRSPLADALFNRRDDFI